MTVTANTMLAEMANVTHQVNVTNLIAVLDHFTATIKVLSLDCFDTLIWRRTAQPNDVFMALQHQPHFKQLGFTAPLRAKAEKKARALKFLHQESSEVTLHEIYLAGFPDLSAATITALMEEEIKTESTVCYPFEPVVNLMRAALARGLKIVIVSDTYFTEPQLKNLLQQLLPSDLVNAIAHIYCSSEYGRSKEQGLFQPVLKSLQLPPTAMLHIGDRLMADCAAPRSLNVHALHFQPEAEHIADLARLQALAAMLFDPSTRADKPLYQPLRGLIAAQPIAADRPEVMLGYASLGMIMYAFAHYICAEVAQLQQAGRKVKTIFLLRDGHLPALACAALIGSSLGSCVRISRFAAYAASFRTVADVDHYLSEMIQSQRFNDIARQLLLPEKVAEPIIRVIMRSQHPSVEFTRSIHRQDILNIIFKKSSEYRQRLLHYLQRETNVTAGDTLLMVDLGYTGTVQNLLAPIFAEMNIDVLGRYLIALPVPHGERNRRGLLDTTHYDLKTLNALTAHIAILEQLCTCAENSVVDFDETGNAIYAQAQIETKQQERLAKAQHECLRFVTDAKEYLAQQNVTLTEEQLRACALAELSRLIYLPTASELIYLQNFQFDINLGTDQLLSLFDADKALSGLQRRGLFFIEKDTSAMRMNYPAELRSAGFELALTYMTQQRFNLDIKLKDMLPRQEFISATLKRGHETHHTTIEAVATYDGFYALWTPVGKGDIELWLKIGKLYHWLQIEAVEFIRMDAFLAQRDSIATEDAWSHLQFEKIEARDTRLFESTSYNGEIGVKPKGGTPTMDYIFRMVYRPIKKRENLSLTTMGPNISFKM